MTKTLFLPGATADASYWSDVADLLDVEAIHFSWPGLGGEAPEEGIESIDDLVRLVLAEIDQPVNIVAQSLGGLIAIKAILQKPEHINRLVLAVTSAGVPVGDLGGTDWRPNHIRRFPNALLPRSPDWMEDTSVDLSEQIALIQVPTLLLWGNEDPISPVAVGERLHSLFPKSELRIISGGHHDLAQTHAQLVAGFIAQHFA
ncbi:alpha/beta fold hydrolase [Sphingobium nicotianae]|uniref:Alpha/beta fold hydrolase n=1 Tax=Sphingobium nicotianae TaxID=2782607 RepID=A0A9X1IRB5_9SPHN|nr:alpha/beta hydrolase [Sphingobium nicotianae]MBT2187306.1 alpha/beta fold hydrolase [Sphingobium nicotianae]